MVGMADMALFDHDVALAQKADIYLSSAALISYCAEGSASPNRRIAGHLYQAQIVRVGGAISGMD